ncbi:MAG: 50S ribosomal protein L17 [Verrucomicrobiota bacterium]|nr:50S ribosomal protein L17 [Verrucomicrobiota bacterium]
MRHRKHNHQLGVKTAHRTSMLANLCCSLIENGRIKTTLARARALRPTIEKIITLAKKAHLAQDTAKKIHYRRLAISRLRSKTATKKLFDELVEQFATREGGYTRIYKLALPRLGDASEMALIEFVEEATSKKNKKKAKKSSKKSALAKDEPKEETEKEETLTPVATELAETDAESAIEDVQGEETVEHESSSDTSEDNATEEVNEQPEVEESGEDSKIEKEDSEESK